MGLGAAFVTDGAQPFVIKSHRRLAEIAIEEAEKFRALGEVQHSGSMRHLLFSAVIFTVSALRQNSVRQRRMLVQFSTFCKALQNDAASSDHALSRNQSTQQQVS